MSSFWTLMEDELGEGYARTFAAGHALHALADRTVVAALDDGVPPRRVWEAVCEDLRVPAERRLGLDRAPVEIPPHLVD